MEKTHDSDNEANAVIESVFTGFGLENKDKGIGYTWKDGGFTQEESKTYDDALKTVFQILLASRRNICITGPKGMRRPSLSLLCFRMWKITACQIIRS